MNAGTSSPRTTVASTSTASATPMPSILMIVTPLLAKAMNTMAMRAAALVTRRPVRCNPIATAAVLSPVRSYSCLMRERRKTS